ncbi:phosphatidylserine/phosphatidylglycerophosphate/cardiolipin synthase-like enzyme [Tamaricihabitans halophyticus]|uniref:phospholipase D n=1 Tax=Tamaricihabitans halophyticus TaxID=1262583 RepID=A0A4R2QW54_9PSEU|nr:phospholipase D-like domain-containing protein [Tamaricihabitans halophyticus]TCP54313.1 phosphatidylserine/phosphatidylglycerophosphate/cardiolipin synthase-like enzyme [Tamaricihabitans halophyticus]
MAHLRIRRLPALLATLAVVIGLTGLAQTGQAQTGQAAANGTAAPGAYTVFNMPSGDTPDTAIEEHIVQLVNEAPEGAEIHGAMYTWTRPQVAEALADAQQRGVQVRLAIDSEGSGGSNAKPDNEAMAVLRDANFTELVFCSGSGSNSSCIGDGDGTINHNKNFTFSATGDKQNVVLVSSHNLTSSQTKSYNNAVVLHDDQDFYDKFVQHMGNLLAQDKDANYYENSPVGQISSTASKATAHFSPRADSNGGTEPEASTDTVVDVLSTITEAEDGCSVDVAQAMFTGSRAPVADELIRIGKLGCTVRVLGGADLSDYIIDRLGGAENVTVRGRLDPLHSKYLVLHGNIDGTAGSSMVLAGSHNLTGPALRGHDETLLTLDNDGVVADFDGNFDTLWAQAG